MHPNALADGVDLKRSADVVDASDVVIQRAADTLENYVKRVADEVIKPAVHKVVKRAADDAASDASDDDSKANALRFADEDLAKSVKGEIEKERAVLSASIQNKQRSDGNAIQGTVEAAVLETAEEGKLRDLANEAKVYKEYSHKQYWYVPGNKTTDVDNLATSGNSTSGEN